MAFTYKNPAPLHRSAGRARRRTARSWSALAPIASPRRLRLPRVPRPSWRGTRSAITTSSLGEGLRAVAAELKAAGFKARVVADDNALVDREAAYRAGLGWFGKSANILLPGQGSWFVLGSVVTDAPLRAGRGSRRRRMRVVPSLRRRVPHGCDRRPGRRRCSSVPCLAACSRRACSRVEHRAALGDRLYGCDECQEVCPPNIVADRRGDEPAAARGVDVLDLLAASDETCSSVTAAGTSPTGPCGISAATRSIVLGNTADGDDPEVERRCAPTSATTTSSLRAARRVGPPTASDGAISSRWSPTTPARWCTPSCEAPARHERLPAEARWDPGLPLGAVAAASSR